jgi:antitoxin HicB
MPRARIRERASQKIASRNYSFTVVFEPLTKVKIMRRNGRKVRVAPNPSWPGYQVTVPLLPGLVTFGRTLSEAREMARDAILCHLEGLRKDGEPIPDERDAIQEKVRVALSA